MLLKYIYPLFLRTHLEVTTLEFCSFRFLDLTIYFATTLINYLETWVYRLLKLNTSGLKAV